ncbi:MAG: type II toxin-antitoxin system VapC family toxin [Actinobacteria bacterium]|nr:type II toxin-antitoxin system VapC family toxin [Actinomycetota bacterium]
MGPVVVDASALIEFLFAGSAESRFDEHLRPEADLHVPELCDIEVVSALRRMLRRRVLSVSDAERVVQDYAGLPLERHRHFPLIGRVFELHHNFTPYDAAYVALAERLEAGLVTADRRLVRAVRRHTRLRCLP